MKVIGICGSPRKGNTEQMLQWVLDSCNAGGADVELVRLSEIKINHCTGCDVCYGTGKPCTIHDDMEELINKMVGADAIIIGTPNYFANVSGLMKNFIDRTNPLCDPPLLKDKAAAFVCVGGQPINAGTDVVEQIFKKYCKDMDLVNVGSVLAKAEDPGTISKNDDTNLSCTNLGNNILTRIQ
ncbi:flavodoxin family protein [Candidatus Woesearchaeota archaeon]|nr:flavodoxin family protein [Candidatus Woesearchaeota archaeon]